MYMENWRPGGTGWMDLDLVGQQSGALVAFVPPVSIKDRSLHWTLVKSQIYCLEHILVYGSGNTCFSLIMGFGSFWTGFLGWLYVLGWGGLSTILRLGLQCWGLKSKLGRGPGPPWQEWNGLVLLVPGIQARRVFSGHPAGHIDSRIVISAWRYGLTTLWHRSKNWQLKYEEMVPFAQPLPNYSLGAYIEGWIRNEMRLLKVRN
jgi:hypothetical protein